MRRTFTTLLLVSMVALAGCGGGDDGGTPDSGGGGDPDAAPSSVLISSCDGLTPAATITTTATAYDPAVTNISVGDVVHFMPTPNHDMLAQDGSWDSGELGAESCGTFTEAGTFDFRCSLHGFTGTINVAQ
jgi:plastocyanin